MSDLLRGCNHKTPTFGCRACLLKARSTAERKIAASTQPNVTANQIRRERDDRRRQAEARKKKKEARLRRELKAARERSDRMRLEGCGHKTLTFGCSCCSESIEIIRMAERRAS